MILVRKWNINWVYLVAAILLAFAVYVATLALFPDWAQSVKLLVALAVVVVVGVFAFLASVRGTLEPSPPASTGTASPPANVAGGDTVAGDKTVEQRAGGDIVNRDKITNQTAGRDFIAGNQIIESAPAGILALHQLASPPPDFTGRTAELAELRQAIHEQGVTILGLRGLGGVGKTALALVLANELTTEYPDAQIFLNLQGVTQRVTPEAVMADVIRAFKPVEKLPDDPDQRAAAYRTILHGQRALLLLDNAADRAQVEPLIPPPGCLLLVTSRTHFALPGLRALDLESLPPTDAEALLLKICPRIDDNAKTLAKLCGYLPLALRLAASALAERPNLGLVTYTRFLQAEQARAELIDASLTLSYNLLSPELQRLWLPLGVFPADFDAPAAAAVWGLDPDPTGNGLGDLLRYSLIEFDHDSQRYRLHDLVHDFVHVRLAEAGRDDAQRRHAKHYKDVLATAGDLYLKGGEDILHGLALFDLERGNILAGQSWAAANAAQDDLAAQLASDYPDAGVYVLTLRVYPRERIVWLETALAAARRLKDRGAESEHLVNLGIVYSDLGEPRRAIEYYEQALVINREIVDRRNDGATLGNLGNAYSDLAEPRRAIEYHEQQLTIARETDDRRGEGNALGSLGTVYSDLLGEPRRAIAYYEQALVIDREIGDRLGEGNLLANLGKAYHDLADARRAIEYYERALVIYREIGDRRGEGNALGSLGIANSDLGEPRRAIEYCEQQLAITHEIGDRAGESRASWNLGVEYETQGDLEKAIALMQVSLDYERQIGHPDAEADAARVEALRAKLAGRT